MQRLRAVEINTARGLLLVRFIFQDFRINCVVRLLIRMVTGLTTKPMLRPGILVPIRPTPPNALGVHCLVLLPVLPGQWMTARVVATVFLFLVPQVKLSPAVFMIWVHRRLLCLSTLAVMVVAVRLSMAHSLYPVRSLVASIIISAKALLLKMGLLVLQVLPLPVVRGLPLLRPLAPVGKAWAR